MRQKVFIFLLSAVLLLSQVTIVDAKGSSRGFSSKSFSSKSFSSGKSKGYSGSSSSKGLSKSLGEWSGSSKKSSSGSSDKAKSPASGSASGSAKAPSGSPSGSAGKGYSGSSGSSSSSRSVLGSYSSGASTKTTTKTNTLKNSYMQDTYKKEASKANYKTYQQKLNDEQKKAYDSSFNKSYNVNSRMGFEDAMRSRPQRISYYNSRPVIVNVNPVYFGGPLSYGSAFIGPWDLWFLMRASDLFWYHHWHEIYAHRDYFNAAEFAAREKAMKQYEAQKIAKNDAYLDPDVDPDLQFSKDYAEKNLNNIYYTNKHASSGTGWVVFIVIIIVIAVILVVIIRQVSKPRKPTFQSRIY